MVSGKGFLCVKVWGSLCLFSLIFLIYPMKMKLFGIDETKFLIFYRIFKNEGQRGGAVGGGGEANPLNPL